MCNYSCYLMYQRVASYATQLLQPIQYELDVAMWTCKTSNYYQAMRLPSTDGASESDNADIVAKRDRHRLSVDAEISRLAAEAGAFLLLLCTRAVCHFSLNF